MLFCIADTLTGTTDVFNLYKISAMWGKSSVNEFVQFETVTFNSRITVVFYMPAAFLAIATAPSLLYHLLNKYRIAIGDCDPPSISGMSTVCDHLKHFLPSWTPSDSSQHSLRASTVHDHAHLNSLYTGQFTSSWLLNPNLGLSSGFLCALRYWQSIPFLFFTCLFLWLNLR